jgi:hypothetical protein
MVTVTRRDAERPRLSIAVKVTSYVPGASYRTVGE